MPRLTQVFAPRDRLYFELFEEAGQNVLRASDLLDRMLSNYPDSKDLAEEIRACEHEGDRITHDIIDRLNHTFVTPIDREDILALASALDDIVDYTEEVADYLGLYKIEAPMDQAIRQARVLKEASALIAEAMRKNSRWLEAVRRFEAAGLVRPEVASAIVARLASAARPH